MPLINTSVPNLIQGVSQQADATRFAGQCEEQENALSAVADGLKKRPNTRHIARLITSAISSNSFVHFINRSADEKYVLILDGTTLRAFNLDTGAQCTINGNDTYTTTSSGTGGYLFSANTTNPPFTFKPREHIKALTVADNTFLLNTTKPVLQNSTNKSDPVTDSAVVTIKQGDYGKAYRLDAVRKIAPAIVSVAIAPVGIKYRHTFTITNPRYAYHRDGTNTGTNDWEQVFKVYPKGFTPNHPAALRAEISVTASDYSSLSSAQKAFIQGTTTSNSRQIVSNSGTGNYSGKVINITKLDRTLLTSPSGSNEGYIDFDEEFLEWVVEAPRDSTPMGTVSITSGGSNASHHSSTTAIAQNLFRPASNNFTVTPTSNSQQARSHSTTDTSYNRDSADNDDQKYVDFSVIEARRAFYDNFSFKVEGSSIVISDFPQLGDSFESYFGVEGAITKYQTSMQDGDSVEFKVSDGLAGAGISVAHNQTDSISSLPAKCLNNFKIKVVGDAELNEDDYYVKFITNSGSNFGDGAFVETSGSNINQQIDSTTFLHRLINIDQDEFSLKSVDPTARTAGDDISNPFPSFVYDGVNGNQSDFTISNLFFFKNRLGLLSNENVIMSEAGEPFNFFRKTTLSLLDSAPIDVAVASNKVTNLKNATGFQENLILFSESGQFVLKSSGLLTPETVSIAPITNFNFEAEVAPLALGSYIYFPFNRGSFTGLREFVVNSSTDTYEAIEVTEHVPTYIPKNIVDMAGTTSEDIIVLLSNESGEQNNLYVYAYFWNNNQKVLSSWSKFTFEDNIRGIEFIESTLYMVTTDSASNTHLVTLPFQSGLIDTDYLGNSAGFNTLLDKRVRVKISANTTDIKFLKADGTYSSNNSDWPYTFYNGNLPANISELFVDADGVTYPLKVQSSANSVRVLLNSDSTASDRYGYVGQPYNMKYTFSTQIFKASSGQSASPSAASAMTIRNGTIFFADTFNFSVDVTSKGRSTATNTFTALNEAEADSVAGTNLKTFTGHFNFPVHSKAKNTAISIQSLSSYDCKFNAAEFESFVHPRSRRYG